VWLKDLFANEILITAIFGWLSAQIIKFFLVILEDKRINFERLIGAGGMPSSHTSFMASMTTAVALSEGVSSPLFAVSVVLSFIVMYDASGVRRAAGEQAALLNKLVENLGHEKLEVTGKRLKELLGHSPLEVFAGAALGIAVAFVIHFIF